MIPTNLRSFARRATGKIVDEDAIAILPWLPIICRDILTNLLSATQRSSVKEHCGRVLLK